MKIVIFRRAVFNLRSHLALGCDRAGVLSGDIEGHWNGVYGTRELVAPENWRANALRKKLIF